MSSLLFEKKIIFFIFVFVLLLFLSGIFSVIAEAKSDKIKGDIKSRMLKGENVSVIIILKDRASLEAVSKGDAAAMKDAASGSQQELSAVLDEEKNMGKANKIKHLWIVNAIAVNASPDLIESLSRRDDVASIEPDTRVQILSDYSAQVSEGQIATATDAIKHINATGAWELGIDGSGINVSVIDTGIYSSHPDISGRVIKWVDFVNGNNASAYDDNGHGTHVAGTVGGNGSGGTTTGVAPNVSLFGVKVLRAEGWGYESDVIQGIEWSVDNGANVISMSLGGGIWTTANCDTDNPAMATAINNAVNAGVVVVAAAGNDGIGVSSPGCMQNVIAVGAVDSSDTIASFSGRGAAMADHGIVAPGVNISSLSYLGGYTNMSGTSMATPHVSGTVALLLNAAQKQGTSLSSTQIKAVLNNTSIDLGDAGKDSIYGAGRINVSAAILSIDTIGPSVTANPTGYPGANTAAKNGTVITLNATITDAISGVKNASVNISSINKFLTDVSLVYDSGFWKNNSIVVTAASDGTYYLNITAYDNMNNINNSSRLSVTIDNTPPNIITTSATPSQIEAGSGSSILRANITDNTSGVAQVTVNLSTIGGSSASPMQNISGIWQLAVNTTYVGNFSLLINATDGAGNSENMNILLNVTDTTPPIINYAAAIPDSISASGTDYAMLRVNTNDFADVSSIKNVTVNLSSIGGSATQEMQNSGGLWLFNVSTNTTGIDGTLISLPVNVTDSRNNSNTTAAILLGIKKTFTAVIGVPISLNLTIGTVNFSISITVPESTILSGEPQVAPIDIPAYGDKDYAGIALNISNMSFDKPLRIEVAYNSSLIAGNESKLRLWSYNTTSSRWEITDNSSVDTINKTVAGYTSRFSIFAPLADVTSPVISGVAVSSITTNSAAVSWTTDEASKGSVRYGTVSGVYTSIEEETSNATSHSVQLTGLSAGTRYYYIVGSKDQSDNTANSTEMIFTTSSAGESGISPSGGAGGGGGGGVSAESAANIEIKEKYDLYIFKDKVTAYAFTDRSNPVLFVNITGNISAGEINTAVEILRNTSSLVKTPASGLIYKNINIWVGTSGFAVPKNIKSAEITFRVEKEWINREGPGTITLYHYDSDWVALPTRKIKEDNVFEYYASETGKFSPFAITMLRAAAPEPESGVAAAHITAAVTADIPAKVNQGQIPVAQKRGTDIILIATAAFVLITAILAAVYILEKMKISFSPK